MQWRSRPVEVTTRDVFCRVFGCSVVSRSISRVLIRIQSSPYATFIFGDHVQMPVQEPGVNACSQPFFFLSECTSIDNPHKRP